jgi:hypothetical protein
MSWLAFFVSFLAGLLVGVPFGRWGWWSRIEDREWRVRSNLLLRFDAVLFGSLAGVTTMSLMSLALMHWLVP